MRSTLFGIALLAAVAPAQLINLYFTALLHGRYPALRRSLSMLFNSCGADTSNCSIVVQTPYARLFGGAPNVYLGLLWGLALTVLALLWIVTGRLVVPWPFLLVAAGTLLLGAYLVHVLVAVLRQPCPL